MTTSHAGRNLLAASVFLSALSACGGGGGDSNPAPTPPTQPSNPAPTPVPAPGAGVTSGDTFAITSTGRLVTFDRADPALDTAIAVSGLQAGETILGIDVRTGGASPGALYALGSTGRLYTLNTTSGLATQIAVLAADAADASDPFTALSGTEYGVDFDPVSDRLRVVSDTGQNLSIDADSGAVITDTPLTSGGNALAGVNGAGYTNAFANACTTTLYYIDATTDQLMTTSDATGGAATVVGSLGVDASAAGDIEIATAADGSNTGYAVLVVGGVPTSYSINLANGAAASAGAVTRLDANEVVRDTAIAPPATAPAQSPGDVFALTESGKLISFNHAAPGKACTNSTLSGQANGESIVGIDVRPADAALYALGSGGHLYTVDTATGALTLKSTLVAALGDVSAPYAGITGTSIAFDFNPGNDLARIVTDTGLNFRVTPDDGVVTTDVALNPAGVVPAEAAYGNSFVGVNASFYYTIDATSDSLVVVGRPSGNAINGDVATIGALNAGDVQGVGGFDILGTTNVGLAALNIGNGTTSDLFTVSLANGAATRVGTIGIAERVRGLAYAKLPVATAVAVTADNHVVTFKPLTPGTLDSDVAVSGLAGSEAIVAVDVRPSNGQVYALTDGGHLYTLDPATGAVSNSVTLTANSLDATAPFTALSGGHFDVDFSAVDGALRVQSDTGQDLRIDVDAGTVITDGTLAFNGGTPQVAGMAFTNPYAGAATATQYSLDVASSNLLRQTSISGAMSVVGTGFNAGTTFMAGGAFDIAGGENGLVVAALQPTGATQSTLYRVNLGTGALTSLGAIGGATTVVKAMTVMLK